VSTPERVHQSRSPRREGPSGSPTGTFDPGRRPPPLQRSLGNRAVGTLLAQLDARAGESARTVAPPVQQPPEAALGTPLLDPTLRAPMECAFGTSFADVNVHTGPVAAAAADALGASAYTVGRDIVFGAGQFDPASTEGRMLIAHELTHIVQQRGATRSGPSAETEAADTEADSAAEKVAVRGDGHRVAVRAPVGVARAEKGYLERARELKEEALAKAEAAKAAALARVRDVEDKARAFAAVATEATRAAVRESTPDTAVVEQKAQAAVKARAAAVTTARKAMPAGKGLARDVVKGYVGTVEGVYLEAANLVDTGLWAVAKLGDAEDLAFGSLDDVAKQAGLGETERKVLATAVRGTAIVVSAGTIGTAGPLTQSLRAAAERTPVDPVTGKPITIDPITGAPMVSGLVSKAFDHVDTAIDSTGAFEGATPDDGLLTTREKSQLVGSIGSQAALAAVGGEEVALGLKIVGALGSLKNIEVAARRNSTPKDPTAFLRSAEFWVAVGNLVLFVIGLHAASSGRKILSLFVDAAILGLATVPPVLKFAHDLEYETGPNRDKILHDDLVQVARAALDVMRQIILHQLGKNAPGGKPTDQTAKGATEQPVVLVKVKPPEHTGPVKPAPSEHTGPVKPALPQQGPDDPYRRPAPPPPEQPWFPIYEKPPPMPKPEPQLPPAPTPEPAKPVKLPPRRRRIDPPPFHDERMPPPLRSKDLSDAVAPKRLTADAEADSHTAAPAPAAHEVATADAGSAGDRGTATVAAETVKATAAAGGGGSGGGGSGPRPPAPKLSAAQRAAAAGAATPGSAGAVRKPLLARSAGSGEPAHTPPRGSVRRKPVVRGATAEGVGEGFDYTYHDPVAPASVEVVRRNGPRPASTVPESPQKRPAFGGDENLGPSIQELFDEAAGRKPGHDSPLESDLPSPQRLRVAPGSLDSAQAARQAGVPDIVIGDAWVFTAQDFPDLSPNPPLPGARPAPPRLPTTGRTVGSPKLAKAASAQGRRLLQDSEWDGDLRITRAELEKAGARLDEVRLNQQQVGPTGSLVDRNRPDLQLCVITGEVRGRRIHIEYDRAPGDRSIAHAERILTNDPDAIVILKIVDWPTK
jgi:hypothetical protein